jgi:hypothetical protein
MVDQDQVRGLDLVETHAERVDPEPVRVLRIANRDVSGEALGEAEPAEQPEPSCELLLALLSLGPDESNRRQRTSS